MPSERDRPEENASPLLMPGCIGVLGGLAFWAFFVALIYASPDPQSGIGIIYSPCCGATYGCILAFATWCLINIRRGDNDSGEPTDDSHTAAILIVPAVFLLIALLMWVVWMSW